ncbi:LysE family translocator [Rhodococcus sp. UNC23MFCrub1.1]|uniref:LysE family translocator n=1 Tax=Rhodococcus sp. UNC23MFCrub1.1 TaxID=1449068 RepID=UPI000480197F|nr:LysE family translocator [Rhodococcus sp. UNC23MFCrub1.1]
MTVDVAVLPGYVAVIVLFLLPPGPDMAYMIAVGLEGGRRAAVRAILGIGTGMALYATAVVLGVGTLARDHPHLLDAVTLLGAGYLLWLGVTTVRRARDAPEPSAVTAGRWYTRGVLVTVTNPKIMLFFLAVLPGFVGEARNTLAQFTMLSAVNISSEIVLYGGIGVMAGGLQSRFSHAPRGATALHYIAGSVFVVLAIVIAAETTVTMGR